MVAETDDEYVPGSPVLTQPRTPHRRCTRRSASKRLDAEQNFDCIPSSPGSQCRPRRFSSLRKKRKSSDGSLNNTSLTFGQSSKTVMQITPRSTEEILSAGLDILEDFNFKTPVSDARKIVQQLPKRLKVDNVEVSLSCDLFSDQPNEVQVQENMCYQSGQFDAMLMERFHRNAQTILTCDSIDSTTDSVDPLAFSGVQGRFFGLPSVVRAILETERGIRDLYDWQKELLQSAEVDRNENVLLSLPTSGGKTLFAEIMLLRCLVNKKKNCIFIVPYVSLVQEKVRGLTIFGITLDFLVEEYAGSRGTLPPQQRKLRNTVYVATIEKASGIVHHLLKENRLGELGLVVVDEVHMLGESGRGATLEALLTKLLFSAPGLQIVGMSATIGNLEELGKFLRAFVFRQKFRPVELREYVVVGSEVYAPCMEERKLTHARTLYPKYSSERMKEDPNLIGHLVLEVVPQNSVLVFCATRLNCENVAKLIIKAFPKQQVLAHRKEEKQALLNTLSSDGGGRICDILKLTLPYGVAYHHSGLTDDERRLLEEAFLNGVICVICCTSTLAAGVNLPAKRVILRSPFVGREFLTKSRYKQMAGRAGRAGFDVEGESYIVCDTSTTSKVLKLFDGPAENAMSSLNFNDGYPLRSFLLSCVVEKLATCPAKLLEVVKCSLWASQVEEQAWKTSFQSAFHWLIDQGLLKLGNVQTQIEIDGTSAETELTASELGKAAIKGNISLDLAQQLYKDLQRGLDALVLNTPLHLLYLLTPYEIAVDVNPDRNILYDMYHKCNQHDIRVFDFLGISALIVQRFMNGRNFRHDVLFKIKRLYCALMLLMLWIQGEQMAASKNVGLEDGSDAVWRVAATFRVDRGRVQNLVSRAAGFGSNIVHFVEDLEPLRSYADLLPPFVEKIGNCSTMELLPLLQLPAVKRARARLLFDSGYKNLSDVARATAPDLVKAVGKLSTKSAKEMILSARMVLTQDAFNLQEMAQTALESVQQFTAVAKPTNNGPSRMI
ncbi:unnamed protein product [Notodromas monacha]|uniref:Helicase POLQ-like n=1 Tax=Notodromas monacha TaxID=399045 RepID=A0A7R9BIY4_9CRUS|nr:unnamed protein product [Notodromas monacha]CAG0914961.1 unnamed protein product [Notodromas monacha]